MRYDDQPFAHGIALMLDHYITWLNLHLVDSRKVLGPHGYNPPNYTPTSFTDPPYGSITVEAAYHTDTYDVLCLTVYDGDDGGPSRITGYFCPPHHLRVADDVPLRTNDDLWYMTQEFDTVLQLIINEGNFVNTPEPPAPSTTTT